MFLIGHKTEFCYTKYEVEIDKFVHMLDEY